jgi:hypothetical protein
MKTMEHQEAIQLKAAERYLLGELSGDLREQFEQHFFECAECAQDVEAGAIFVESARQILGYENAEAPVPLRPRPESRGWFGSLLRPAFAGPALAILILFAVYQNAFVLPNMKTQLIQANAPHVLPWFSLITENSRGGAALTVRVPNNAGFGLFVDIPPQKQFAVYNCAVETESGTPKFSVKVSLEQATSNLQLLIPPSLLKAGKYVLVVRGSGSNQVGEATQMEVARYPFALEFTN